MATVTSYILTYGQKLWHTAYNGFVNYVKDYLDEVEAGRGSRADLNTRLSEAHNPDGSHFAPITASSLWSAEADAFTRLGDKSFKTTAGGDHTGIYTPGRAVRDNAGNSFTVATASFSDPDTTVNLVGDAALASTLTSIEYGQEVANGPVRDLASAMAAKALAYGNIPGSL